MEGLREVCQWETEAPNCEGQMRETGELDRILGQAEVLAGHAPAVAYAAILARLPIPPKPPTPEVTEPAVPVRPVLASVEVAPVLVAEDLIEVPSPPAVESEPVAEPPPVVPVVPKPVPLADLDIEDHLKAKLPLAGVDTAEKALAYADLTEIKGVGPVAAKEVVDAAKAALTA